MFEYEELMTLGKALSYARNREHKRWKYYTTGAGKDLRGAKEDAQYSLSEVSNYDALLSKLKVAVSSARND